MSDRAKLLEIWYRNYRGEVAKRHIIPKGIVFGDTEWHPESQWLLHAWDEDKQAYRYFAIKDFVSPQPEDPVGGSSK